MNPQAEELNKIIQESSPVVFSLLSQRGKSIFFPKKGILGQTAEAKGKAINATIGIALEDDGSPVRLKAIEEQLLLSPADIFPYASSYGKPELRTKWKEMIAEKNPSLKSKFSLPVVTNALTHGLSMCGYLFMDQGEKIIIPDLYWGNYNLIFSHMYGTTMDTFTTFVEGGFNVEGLKQKLAGEGEKKIVLLNFPNNPTGYTITNAEKEQIITVITEAAKDGKKIVVLLDDAYFGLVFQEGIFTESLFADLADAHENILAVKLDGATKEDYVWGFRVGFLTFAVKGASEETLVALEAKVGGAIRGNISNAPHISQSLVLKAFESPSYSDEKKQKFELLKERCQEVQNVLDTHSEYKENFTALPFNSGYFMCVKLIEGLDAEKVRKVLLDKYDTGIIALGNLIRVAFSAAPKKDIPKLFENLNNACDDVRN